MINDFNVPQINPANPEIPAVIADRLGPYREVFSQLVDVTLGVPGIDAMVLTGSRSPRLPRRYVNETSDLDLYWIVESYDERQALLAGIGKVLSHNDRFPDYFGGSPYDYWWMGNYQDMEVGVNVFERGGLLKMAQEAYQYREIYEKRSGFLQHKIVEAVPLLLQSEEISQASEVALNIPEPFRLQLLAYYGRLLNLQVTGARGHFKNFFEFMSDLGGQNGILATISRQHHAINRMHFMPADKQYHLDAALMEPDIVEELRAITDPRTNWGVRGEPIRSAIASINDKFKRYYNPDEQAGN
jgi:hypothetical protein